MKRDRIGCLIIICLFALLWSSFRGYHSGKTEAEAFFSDDDSTENCIVVYGDTRNGHDVHKRIIQQITELRPEAVFHTGDLVFNGKCKRNWIIFNDIVGDLLKIAPIYPAMGNHELGTLKIQQEMDLPNDGKWYSVDIQNIHFVILDVISDYSWGSDQYHWLERDLENQPGGTEFTVVITHYPFYTSSFHATELVSLRNELIPVFQKNGVDIVFSGHNHCYERCFSNGIYYITSAGGGAPLYNKNRNEPASQLFVKTNHFCMLKRSGDSLVVSAMDTNGLIVDRFPVANQRAPLNY